jgi:hypothetical protein
MNKWALLGIGILISGVVLLIWQAPAFQDYLATLG